MLFKVDKLRAYTVVAFCVFFFTILFGAVTTINGAIKDENNDEKLILYINSYHEGYKWSDDIQDTIEASFASSILNINVETIYLDTQRINNVNPIEYYEALLRAIQIQYERRRIDLIITSDDAAFEFVHQYLSFLDDDIPMLFCGVNEIEKINLDIGRNKGGIVEHLDIKDTVNLIKRLHPGVETIYYVCDTTLTGIKIEAELLTQLTLSERSVDFIKLEVKNLVELEEVVKDLDESSVVLYTIYFYDNENQYYEYDEAISRLSLASAVPIYGLWEFSLGHGVVGGKLLSGVEQGEAVAKQALDYLTNENYEFVNIIGNNNAYKFDYNQLVKYGIELSELPINADVINYSTISKKNILVIHSYNQGFQWTDHIMDGMSDSLEEFDGNYEIYTEYMDLKRIDTSVYLHEYTTLFNEKHKMRNYDLIMTSDEGAFNFAKAYIQRKDPEIPIVFSGINYLEKVQIDNHYNYTGVMEFYDLKKTFELIVKLQPEVTRLLVINDQTLTGQSNTKNVETIKKEYSSLDIFQIDDLSMTEVVELVKVQKENTAILLMSYNIDRANNNFSYEESISIIEDASSVPIYSVWDFYLGDGVVGGYMTNGYEQGQAAGKLGLEILNGVRAADLEIITVSPNKFMIDMNQIEKYNINKYNIPKNVIIINEKQTLTDVYIKYKNIINIVIIVIFVIIFIFIVLSYLLRNSIRMNKKITQLANYDQLTQILNRREGIEQLKAYVQNPSNFNKKASICFIDINDLKVVNDKYGHGVGDQYIIKTLEVIKMYLGKDDILCRMGGDEFMAVLKTELVNETEFIPNIKDELVKMNTCSTEKYIVSISAGVYTFIINDQIDVTKVIEAADTLMYADKSKYKMSLK